MAQAGWPRFMLRLPPDLKRWVDAEAERNGASINSEIIRSVRERMDRGGYQVSRNRDDFSRNRESRADIPDGTPLARDTSDSGGGSAIQVIKTGKSDDGQSLAAPVVAPEVNPDGDR